MATLNIRIISAGAGSGKTYRLTKEMAEMLSGASGQKVRASGIIATTFTNKAAAELKERVRTRLLQMGLNQAANDIGNALIGTVHGLGVKLLKRFAFEAGVSPEVDIIADEDQQVFFNNALAAILVPETIEAMEARGERLGLNKKGRSDWRKYVKTITDLARANAFDAATLEQSKARSIASLFAFLPPVHPQKNGEALDREFLAIIENTLYELKNNDADTTKDTQQAINALREVSNTLQQRNHLNWHDWARVCKLTAGKKSRNLLIEATEHAMLHEQHPLFQEDLSSFIALLFDISIAALREYEAYKNSRGLIDYIDMEIHVNQLLENPAVREVLRYEVDLLMVDEFQDTSPIQLEIFLKLAKLAKQSIWVGDPKQSIYGFRGADPALMEAIIEQTGGVQPADIQPFSWRSRPQLVHAVNAIFVKAFPKTPPERVALSPKRAEIGDQARGGSAIIHWHFEPEGKTNNLEWFNQCVAKKLHDWLATAAHQIEPKNGGAARPVRAGDVAILCRSNKDCNDIAEALHRNGLKAAIARNGLLATAEAKLTVACLKYILNPTDTLSVAEVLLLADRQSIEHILDHRLEHLNSELPDVIWATENPYIRQLATLRTEVSELSASEILNLVLETLDLRRIIAAWGNIEQRMANVDALRQKAHQYEETCNRLHTAASLGGFLLWLNDLEESNQDEQGSGESPDAVNVLTYHKSKGLEWAVVICCSLENSLRDSPWDAHIVADSETVDLDQPLANRWLRFWLNPYSDQDGKMPLMEKVNRSDAKKQATAAALEEEKRLLYVGFTRARDYLVLPTRAKKPTLWLNRVWQNGQEDLLTLHHQDSETPWVWQGVPIPKATEVEVLPANMPNIPVQQAADIRYIAPPAPKPTHRPRRIDVDREDFSKLFNLKITNDLRFAPPLEAETAPAEIAKVVKALLAMVEPPDDLAFLEMRTFELIHKFAVPPEALDPFVAIKQIQLFSDWLETTCSPQQLLKKCLLQYETPEGRWFETVVDVLAFHGDALTVVQHSSFAGAPAKYAQKVKSLGGWWFWVQNALQAAFPHIKHFHLYMHFVLGGAVVPLEIHPHRTSQMVLFK